jgi:hypothetical protein
LRAGAIAAVVVCLALLAGSCTTPSDDPPAGRSFGGGVGPPPQAPLDVTIALAPGRLWLGVDQVTLASEGPAVLPALDTAVFVPDKGADGPVVFAQVVDESVPLDDVDSPRGEPVSSGELTGTVGVDESSDHRWLEAGAGNRHVTLWAGREVSADQLIQLASTLDLAQPLSSQTTLPGWRQATTSGSAVGRATVREVEARRAGGGADIHVSLWTGVGDDALLVLGGATVAEPARVRNRPGLVSLGSAGNQAVVTWLEGPGLVGQVRYSTAGQVEPGLLVEAALAEAEALTRLDKAGWQQLATSARRRAWPPRPTADQLDPPRLVFRGAFRDGRSYTVSERDGQTLCVTVEGNDGVTRCDTDRQFWRGRSTEAMPRLLDPGDPLDIRSPVLLYGYLPSITLGGEAGIIQSAIGPWLEAGRAQSVQVADSRGIDLGQATIVDDVWVHHVPDNERPLVVTYTFRDGTSVEVVPGPGRSDAEAQ